jgi:hypothetical protein
MERDDIIRSARFMHPERIPFTFLVIPACWLQYDTDELENLFSSYPSVFGNFRKIGAERRKIDKTLSPNQVARSIDAWGCEWETSMTGILGVTVGHPLNSWENFKNFTPPDPKDTNGMVKLNWDNITQSFNRLHEQGRFTSASLEHGHLFLRLTYLRGYENLICDMFDEEPILPELIGMVENFSMELTRRYLALKPDCMGFPEDLGTQTSLLVSPTIFRKYLKPTYSRLMKTARDAGAIVEMHSDGRVLDLVDDLIECGVEVLNIQDLVNGIDNIKRQVKGRIALMLDIDRQSITRFGTPKDIDDLIREEVMELGSPEGGLSFIYGLYPGIPVENIKAVLDSLIKYSTYYS